MINGLALVNWQPLVGPITLFALIMLSFDDRQKIGVGWRKKQGDTEIKGVGAFEGAVLVADCLCLFNDADLCRDTRS